MRRAIVAFSALTLVGLGLTGCGLNRVEQREAWRTQAEEACLSQKLVTPSAYMSRASEIDGPGTCGISYPFKVAAFGDGSVGLTQKATLGCPIIPRIDGWLDEVVQPAASLYFGTSVVEVKSGSYSCRSRNNQRGAKVSEHGYGNAIDVMAFRFADGREVAVVRGWTGAPEEQEFLREVFVGACTYFSTVLGPGADPFHYDHLHLDLARHDARGQRHICKPLIKFEPRLGNPAVAQSQTRIPVQQAFHQPAPQSQTLAATEDDDPFAAPRPVTRSAPAPIARPAPAPTPAPTPVSRPASTPSAPVAARPGPSPAVVRPANPSAPATPLTLQPHLWTGEAIY